MSYGEKMSNYKVLNPVEHKNTRILTERGEALGDNIQYSLTYPLEFRNIQSCYPIFFSKNAETGDFLPIALFGFEKNENLENLVKTMKSPENSQKQGNPENMQTPGNNENP